MAYSSRSSQRAALLAGAVAIAGLLTACGSHDVHSTPQKVSGTAGPATETSEGSASSATSAASTPGDGKSSSAPEAATSSATGTGTKPGSSGSRCHTSELRASVGRDNPGAGQENFPVVLTNESARTCTLRGFPGAAFVNASGSQLGPDPRRESGSPATVTLKPGQSAWAGLTFSNPEVSGAHTGTPTALLITPPDERDPLKVMWTAGPVPVSGNSSSVFLTMFSPGTGA
ncbi:hypothetical protein AQI88_36125 [Streptomyces cellostaticus]|uniref:DUF4232 domain-containing protein n=1 Tax=Streptomyces cellostaticus TaxID=67285 RepID=A0A101NEA1_9ACTN|nr:DUF4232 domain-containing protein [Streptomyces cellostaticus]KUM91678.1 hypothetical protein AQI88_36125 [Streptomyces cellostaticus]GHI03688.1 lipoprotein [Streptomyces cellostaticus]